MIVSYSLAKSKQKTKKLSSKNNILGIGIITAIVIVVSYFAYSAMIPVNADFPMFGMPTNVYIKTISTDAGSVFASQSVKGGKNAGAPNGIHNPTFTVSKGNLISIHFINEDRGITNIAHKHDLNIDEFNVHSNVLNHFQAQTITFFADKQGTFDYYCSIHPEMRGKIIVT
jgi:plastocyanin